MMANIANKAPLFSLFLLLMISCGLAAEVNDKPFNLTIELVEKRITNLQTEGIKNSSRITKDYKVALGCLKIVKAYDLDVSGHLKMLTEAPKQEAEIQARMDAIASTKYISQGSGERSRQELEAQLILTRKKIQDAKNNLKHLESRLANREANAKQIKSDINEIEQRLAGLNHLEMVVDVNARPTPEEASLWVEIARKIALIAERQSKESILICQPVRYSLLRAQSAELKQKIDRLNQVEKSQESFVRNKLVDVGDPEKLGIEESHPIYKIVERLILEDRQLREDRLLIEARLDTISQTQDEIESITHSLSERVATTRRVVNFASDSELLGKVLLANWEEIKTFRLAQSAKRFPHDVGNTVISRIDHEKALVDIIRASGYTSQLLEEAGLKVPTISAKDQEIITELVRSKRELLRRIIAVESEYIDALEELEESNFQLTTNIDEYQTYLSPLILWIPSREPLWTSDFSTIPSEFSAVVESLAELEPQIRWSGILALIAAAGLLLARSRLRSAQRALKVFILKPEDATIKHTFFALLLNGARAATVPVMIFFVITLYSEDRSLAAIALVDTLLGLNIVLYCLSFMYILSEKKGIGRTHFYWHSKTCNFLQKSIGWLIWWWIPLATIASFFFMLNDVSVLLGRLSLLLSIFLLIFHLCMSIRRGIRQRAQKNSSQSAHKSIYRPRYLTMLILIAVLMVVVAGIVWGLRYSVSIVTSRLVITLWLAVSLLVIYHFLVRWLHIIRCRIRLADKLAAQSESSDSDAHPVQDDESELVSIGAETKRFVFAATSMAGVLILLYIWTPLFPAYDALGGVVLWSVDSVHHGESSTMQVTLETLFKVLVLIGATFYGVNKLPSLVELVLRSRTTMSASMRYTTRMILSYTIVSVGIVFALSALGLRWSQLQWLIAALSVGVGFGLQEIIANFISGIIILFERPIRVGDFVTVGGIDGTITKIRIRATTILGKDGKELLVPNKEFITGRLLNWTLSNPNVRVAIPVGISYGKDVGKALEILGDIVKNNSHVLDSPEPSTIFYNFGDNALEIKVQFFIESMDHYWSILTEVRLEIYDQFRASGISIAFPQRDVHLDIEQPIQVVIDPGNLRDSDS